MTAGGTVRPVSGVVVVLSIAGGLCKGAAVVHAAGVVCGTGETVEREEQVEKHPRMLQSRGVGLGPTNWSCPSSSYHNLRHSAYDCRGHISATTLVITNASAGCYFFFELACFRSSQTSLVLSLVSVLEDGR